MPKAKASGPLSQDEWIAGLAHEVRNRLNSLQIHVGIIDQELDGRSGPASSLSAHVQRIAQEIRDLDELVCDLVRFAQASAPAREEIALPELLAELATFLGPECATRGVRLELAQPMPALSTLGDRAQLKSALLNLLLNALQATPPGGRVEVALGSRPGAVTIAVRDTGAGVPPAIRQRLFEPFASRRPGGTGLGLAIAHRVVTSHGGTIEVETRVGKGSAFTVFLPDQERRTG
jgi:two-component system sensor histidine kinase HydH